MLTCCCFCPQICLVLALAACAFAEEIKSEESAETKEKRGALGLGYGAMEYHLLMATLPPLQHTLHTPHLLPMLHTPHPLPMLHTLLLPTLRTTHRLSLRSPPLLPTPLPLPTSTLPQHTVTPLPPPSLRSPPTLLPPHTPRTLLPLWDTPLDTPHPATVMPLLPLTDTPQHPLSTLMPALHTLHTLHPLWDTPLDMVAFLVKQY